MVVLRYRGAEERVSFLEFSRVATMGELMEIPHDFEVDVDAKVSEDAFLALVRFVSKGLVEVTKANCTDVMLLANTYGVFALSCACYKFMCRELGIGEVVERVIVRDGAGQRTDDIERYFAERILELKGRAEFFRAPCYVIFNAIQRGRAALNDSDVAEFCVNAHRNHGDGALRLLELANLPMVKSSVLMSLQRCLVGTKPYPMFQFVESVLESRNMVNSMIETRSEEVKLMEEKMKKLVEATRQALSGNATEAHFLLGNFYEDGEFVPASAQDAFTHYSEAAAGGNVEAMLKVARCYEFGRGTNADKKKAVAFYEKAANKGRNDALLTLAHVCLSDSSIMRTRQEFATLQRAADLGDANSQFALGQCYLQGQNVRKDNVKAIEWFRRAADNGHQDAREVWYGVRADVNADTRKQAQTIYAALEQLWPEYSRDQLYQLRLIADAGYSEAIITYGRYLMETGDEEEAEAWLNRGLENSTDGKAYYWMARLRLKYHSKPNSVPEAIALLMRASAFGEPTTQMMLGSLITKGYWKESRNGTNFFEQAGRAGLLDAVDLAAKCYHYGLGVDIDFGKACSFYKLLGNANDMRGQFGIAKLKLSGYEHPTSSSPMDMIKAAKHSVVPAGFMYACLLLGSGFNMMDNIDRVRKMLTKRAANDSCCALLARIKFQFFPSERRSALESLWDLIAKSFPIAKYMLGKMLLEGSDFRMNEEAGISFIRDAADHSSPSALLRYGQFLLEKRKTKEGREEALRCIWKASEYGLRTALYYYAMAIMPDDEITAVSYLRILAAEGNRMAAYEYSVYCVRHYMFDEASLFLRSFVGQSQAEALFYFWFQKVYAQVEDPRTVRGLQLSMNKGYKHSLYALSDVLSQKGQLDQAINLLLAPVAAGDTFAMYKLGAIAHIHKVHLENDPLDLIRLAADNGCTDALWKYGTMLRDGDGLAKDEHEAIKWFELSAKAGNPTGKVCLADALLTGKVVEKDEKLAFQLFNEAAEQGSKTGMWCYANCLHRGIGCERNDIQALRVFWQLASFNDRDAMYQVGKMMLNGIMVPQDGRLVCQQDAKAGFEYMDRAARLGHSTAQWRLGYFWLMGIIVEKNEEVAARFFKLSADSGNHHGIWYYAEALLNGTGVPKNPKQAAEYFRVLSEAGDSRADYKYGMMLVEGKDIPKDIPAGLRLLNKAVAAGNSDAQWKVGAMLMDGLCTCDNPEETAARLFQASAESNNPTGLWHYGQCLVNGTGVPKDTAAGMELIRRAAGLGHPDSLMFYARALVSGEYVDRDVHKSLEYVRALATSDNPAAWLMYSNIVLRTEGSNEADKKLAIDLVKKAAITGHIEARTYYGRLLCEGTYVEPNPEHGVFYLKLAADHNDSEAQCELGECFLRGLGVPKNSRRAAVYFRLSASNGCIKGRYFYGRALVDGDGVEKNEEEGRRLIAEAVQQGYHAIHL